MRDVVLTEVLRMEISAVLKKEMDTLIGVPALVIERVEPLNGGPNWRISFRAGDTPLSYAKPWDRIRHGFEKAFDICDG